MFLNGVCGNRGDGGDNNDSYIFEVDSKVLTLLAMIVIICWHLQHDGLSFILVLLRTRTLVENMADCSSRFAIGVAGTGVMVALAVTGVSSNACVGISSMGAFSLWTRPFDAGGNG